jgi:hypothetical protein
MILDVRACIHYPASRHERDRPTERRSPASIRSRTCPGGWRFGGPASGPACPWADRDSYTAAACAVKPRGGLGGGWRCAASCSASEPLCPPTRGDEHADDYHPDACHPASDPAWLYRRRPGRPRPYLRRPTGQPPHWRRHPCRPRGDLAGAGRHAGPLAAPRLRHVGAHRAGNRPADRPGRPAQPGRMARLGSWLAAGP